MQLSADSIPLFPLSLAAHHQLLTRHSSSQSTSTSGKFMTGNMSRDGEEGSPIFSQSSPNPYFSPAPITPTTILNTLQQSSASSSSNSSPIFGMKNYSPSASKHHTFGRAFVQPLKLPPNDTSSSTKMNGSSTLHPPLDAAAASSPVPSITVLQRGVVLIRHCLSPVQQVELAKAVCMGHGRLELTSPLTQIASPLCERTSIFALHHKDALNRAPVCLQRCLEVALAQCRSMADQIPPTFVPRHITAERYAAPDGVLRNHCDKLSGWSVLFALGCSSQLSVQGSEMPSMQTLPFHSGDAFVFNGGEEWGVSYGLSGVNMGTCPRFLRDQTGNSEIPAYSPLHKVVNTQDILIDGALVIHARQGRDEKPRKLSRN